LAFLADFQLYSFQLTVQIRHPHCKLLHVLFFRPLLNWSRNFLNESHFKEEINQFEHIVQNVEIFFIDLSLRFAAASDSTELQ
jgi:hypothetical protein